MAKQKLVTVHMDRIDEYEIDRSTKRSLPIGWRGRVPQKIAKALEARGSGRIIPDPAPPEKGKSGSASKSEGTGKDTGSAPKADPTAATSNGAQTGTQAAAATAAAAANAGGEAGGAATVVASGSDGNQGAGGTNTGAGS